MVGGDQSKRIICLLQVFIDSIISGFHSWKRLGDVISALFALDFKHATGGLDSNRRSGLGRALVEGSR